MLRTGMATAVGVSRISVGDLSSGTVSVSFEVEDADAAAVLLREQGVEARESLRDEWGTAVEIVDPDGYTIKLFQRPG